MVTPFARLVLFCAASVAAVSALAAPRPPLPPFPEPALNSWRFDTQTWLTNPRTAPLAFDNIPIVESWSGYALRVAGRENSLFALPEQSPDGQVNLPTAGPGTVRFYFAPDWSSAPEGPGPLPLN